MGRLTKIVFARCLSFLMCFPVLCILVFLPVYVIETGYNLNAAQILPIGYITYSAIVLVIEKLHSIMFIVLSKLIGIREVATNG